MTDYGKLYAAEQRDELTKVYRLVEQAESAFNHGVGCENKAAVRDTFRELFALIAEADDELARDSGQ